MKRGRLLLLVFPLIAGAFYLRSLASWRPRKVFTGQGQVSILSFSGDGGKVLVGHSPSNGFIGSYRPTGIKLLDVNNDFTLLWQSRDKFVTMGRSQFIAQNSQISLGTRRVDARTGSFLKKYIEGGVRSFSPDGQWLADSWFAGNAMQVYIYTSDKTPNYERALDAAKILGSRNQLVQDVAFSPNGKQLVVCVGQRKGTRLDFYDVNSWRLMKSVSTPTVIRPLIQNRSGGLFRYVQWSRNGRFMLSWGWLPYYPPTGGEAFDLTLWRVSDTKKLASTQVQDVSGRPQVGPLRFEVQNDGSVLSVIDDKNAYLSSPANLNLKSRRLLLLPHETITVATMSPDGSYLLAGTQSGRIYWQRVK